MKNLQLLSKIALAFQNTNEFDQQIEGVLEDIGKHIDVSRISIYLNENDKIVKNTFEWCNEQATSEVHTLQNMEKSGLLSWNNIITEEGQFCSDDINKLPQDIIDILKAQNIKSIVVYPLIVENKRAGYIGFDECRHKRVWKKEELEILNTVSGIIANAYERKLFQEDLISSETNFRDFFETIDDMFIVSDLEGEVLHSNNSLIDKLGYNLSELKTMNLLDFHVIDRKHETSILLDEMLRGEINKYSLEIESKLGDKYLVETRTWFGKWNKQNCIYIISKDVTQESENLELFSKIFEHNPLGMAITSKKESKFIKVNPAFLERTGYCEDEIIGKTMKDIDVFLASEKIKDISERLRQSGEIKNEEITLQCKDGSEMSGLLSVEEININGTKSFLSVIVDITERVELAKDLEDKYQKLSNIIEGTKLGTWEWNIETGHLEINDQWAKLIGYTLDELGSTRISTWYRFTHPEDLKISEELIEKHLKDKTDYYDCEIRMKHKDGRWIWVHDRGKVTERDSKGKPIKMFGTHSEITQRKEAAKALQESEKRFFLALDKAKAGLWDFDMLGEEVFLSSMWKKILGYENHELKDSLDSWRNLWHPDDGEKILKAEQDYLDGKTKSYEVTHRLKHKDGNWRWILSRGGVMRNAEGVAYRWIGTNTDVTTQHEQSLELERIFSVNLDLLCVIDMDGNFIKVNQAWSDILGYTMDKLKGHNVIEFIHPDDIEKTRKVLAELEDGKKQDGFVNRYKNSDGSYCYLEWKSNPYEGSVYAAARDITDRIEYERKILEVSNRDALTNVYNRRYIFERANEMVAEYKRHGKAFSVSIIDIDHFKRINDSYGHQVGDSVLKAFTKLIDKHIRLEDILGRYGGEEFIVILNNVNEDENNLIIERILDIIREEIFTFDGNDIRFTFSAGVSSSTEIEKDGLIIDKLVELADKRMYEAKNSGRNKVIF